LRDIWILDAEGRRRHDLGGCGLSTDVWRALYPVLDGDPEHPILARLWREHWGPGGDAVLSWDEVGALASELESLRGQLGPEAPESVRELLDGWAALCAKARERGDGLELVAD